MTMQDVMRVFDRDITQLALNGHAPLSPAEELAELEMADQERLAKSGGSRQIILTPASKIRPKRVAWLWDTTPEGAPPTSQGRIPLGQLAIAAGMGGLGKSQFACWMAARVTTGTLPGEMWGKPRSVIYGATEDDWERTIAPRLIAAGADLDLVFRIDVVDDEAPHAKLTLPADTSLLGPVAEEYCVSLVILDPLLSFIDASINDYRAAEVRRALEPLVAQAQKHSFTILGLAHFTKSGGTDPLLRIAGSGAFGQLIRAGLTFARQKNDEGGETMVMSLSKNNLGRMDVPSHEYILESAEVDAVDGTAYVSRFVLGGESGFSVEDVLRDDAVPGARESLGDAADWLRNYLVESGGSAMKPEIMKAAAKEVLSLSTVNRAAKRLKVASKLAGFGKEKSALWSLPEAAQG